MPNDLGPTTYVLIDREHLRRLIAVADAFQSEYRLSPEEQDALEAAREAVGE